MLDRHCFMKQLSSVESMTIVYMYNNCIYVPVVLKSLPNQDTHLASSPDKKDTM